MNKTKPIVVELDDSIYRMCALPNDLLCLSYSKSNKLALYSKKFQKIRTIDQISNLKFNNPRGVATNNLNKVVICDSYNSRLILTDLDFKTCKTIGQCGTGPYEFNAPYDAFFSKNYLFVCDCKNFRIQKFTDELEFLQIYLVDYCPFQLRILNDTICIRDFDDRIYFYDIDNFTEKETKHDNKGIIANLGDNFIQLDFKLEKIHAYSVDGSLEYASKASYGSYKNCDMCIFDDNLVITGNDNKLLLI